MVKPKHRRNDGKEGKLSTCSHGGKGTMLDELNFKQLLASLGLEVKIMRGDGNCLFRSLSDQLTATEDNHSEYRQRIVDYIVEHQDHFRLFMEDDEDFDAYISRMRRNGEWGGNQELYAASQCLRVNIVVHQVCAPRYILQYENESNNVNMQIIKDIHISYHGECHYNSVRATLNSVIPLTTTAIKDTSSQPTSRTEKQKSALVLVRQACPKLSEEETIAALELVDWIADDAIEFICCNSDSMYLITQPQDKPIEESRSLKDSHKKRSSSASLVTTESILLLNKSMNKQIKQKKNIKSKSINNNKNIDFEWIFK
eukprot:gene12051-16127_t